MCLVSSSPLNLHVINGIFSALKPVSSRDELAGSHRLNPPRVVAQPPQEVSRQANVLWQQRSGNPDLLCCMNRGFVQPSSAWLQEGEDSSLAFQWYGAPARSLATLPRPSDADAKGWAMHTKSETSRVPVSHPKYFTNIKKNCFSWLCRGRCLVPACFGSRSYTFKIAVGNLLLKTGSQKWSELPAEEIYGSNN